MTSAATWRAPLRPALNPAYIALLPMALATVIAYVASLLWSLRISLSSSRSLPLHDFVGLAQYQRLFSNERWQHSLHNLALYTPLFIVGSLLIGFLLALLVDRQLRGGGALRSIFLYPYALSFIATGLVWQWLLNPELGIQQVVRGWGFAGFRFDWLVDQDRVVYTIVIATIWQGAGLVMAILLAGLRGIDPDILRAARLDGVPAWRIQTGIVIPMLRFSFATAALLLLTAAVKLYDAVVAMTQGGPGTASEVPAKFIMDHLFGRANIALASAGAVVMVLTVVALLAPLLYARSRASRVRP